MLREARISSGRDEAEKLAISALSWLAGDPEVLSRFLALSGIGPSTLRQAAGDPAFLAGVLDFLSGDERLLLAFAASAGEKPESIGEAREILGRAQ